MLISKATTDCNHMWCSAKVKHSQFDSIWIATVLVAPGTLNEIRVVILWFLCSPLIDLSWNGEFNASQIILFELNNGMAVLLVG